MGGCATDLCLRMGTSNGLLQTGTFGLHTQQENLTRRWTNIFSRRLHHAINHIQKIHLL